MGCRSFARDISDSAADAAALQPLTGRRAAQLGLTQLATDSLHANMPLPKNKLAEVQQLAACCPGNRYKQPTLSPPQHPSTAVLCTQHVACVQGLSFHAQSPDIVSFDWSQETLQAAETKCN